MDQDKYWHHGVWFVVEKFALFLAKIAYFLGKGIFPKIPTPSSHRYSSIFGIILVAMGALMGVLSFVRYKKVEKK